MNVTVTDEMLDAAMKKAVEAGLVPRGAWREDTLGYQELVRNVVHAALAAGAITGSARSAGAQVNRNGAAMRRAEAQITADRFSGNGRS